ncbi:hypothetical protein [Oscillibacter ruminantium]|uniref:hypothetical protein n=1 Tax=Oscillibacter ruminantium TaxID=1263547 RepID=UPI00332BE1AA
MDYILNLTPAIVVGQRTISANAHSTVGPAIDAAPFIRLLALRIGNPSAGGATACSLNHPLGMCPACSGLGQRMLLDEETLFDPQKPIRQGGIRFFRPSGGSWQGWLYRDFPLLDADKPFSMYC